MQKWRKLRNTHCQSEIKKKKKKKRKIPNSVDPDETARHEPSHLDLHCLQMYLFLSIGLKELKGQSSYNAEMKEMKKYSLKQGYEYQRTEYVELHIIGQVPWPGHTLQSVNQETFRYSIQCLNFRLQSTLVISNSKGLSETLRDIRTPTYQSCGSEENNKSNNHI